MLSDDANTRTQAARWSFWLSLIRDKYAWKAFSSPTTASQTSMCSQSWFSTDSMQSVTKHFRSETESASLRATTNITQRCSCGVLDATPHGDVFFMKKTSHKRCFLHEENIAMECLQYADFDGL